MKEKFDKLSLLESKANRYKINFQVILFISLE